ncbi:MAG: hypothetical protein O7G32_03605 [SAR324 cluster bacterium]|nr:hypothetical protein [SAR324 cluster bacterium]
MNWAMSRRWKGGGDANWRDWLRNPAFHANIPRLTGCVRGQSLRPANAPVLNRTILRLAPLTVLVNISILF